MPTGIINLRRNDMSLDWDVSRVKNWRELVGADLDDADLTDEHRTQCNIRHALVWATMAIGINQITEANADEVALRMRAWEIATQSDWIIDWGSKKPDGSPSRFDITPAHVKRWAGLYTNAGRLSHDKFISRLGHHVLAKAQHQMDCIDRLKEEA